MAVFYYANLKGVSMGQNNFGISLIAFLEKVKSEKRIKSDIKTFDDIHFPLIGKLAKTRTKAQLKKDIEAGRR